MIDKYFDVIFILISLCHVLMPIRAGLLSLAVRKLWLVSDIGGMEGCNTSIHRQVINFGC